MVIVERRQRRLQIPVTTFTPPPTCETQSTCIDFGTCQRAHIISQETKYIDFIDKNGNPANRIEFTIQKAKCTHGLVAIAIEKAQSVLK